MVSVNQSSEMLALSDAPQGAIVSNELLGAVLLLIMLEYMQSEDEQEKQNLLALAMMVAQAQVQSSQSSSLTYVSTSLSVESTQIMMAGSATSAYTNAGANPTGSAESAAGAVDVTA